MAGDLVVAGRWSWGFLSPELGANSRARDQTCHEGLVEWRRLGWGSGSVCPTGQFRRLTLVLTKKGFWLVEIKSWPGRLGGDVGTWTRTRDGRTISEDSPVLRDRPADKREGWDAKRLTPLLGGLEQLLPWIHQWHPEVDPEFGETAGQSFRTMLEADAHELGLTMEAIRAWEPPAKEKGGRKKKG